MGSAGIQTNILNGEAAAFEAICSGLALRKGLVRIRIAWRLFPVGIAVVFELRVADSKLRQKRVIRGGGELLMKFQ
jgi:hypothetical protein